MWLSLIHILNPGMAPLEPLDRQLQGPEITRGHRLGLIAERDVGVESAGAAHIELALGLGVEVEQDIALEQPFFQAESAVHAGLLGRGEERFEGAVYELSLIHICPSIQTFMPVD